jgi:hypothetical protein
VSASVGKVVPRRTLIVLDLSALYRYYHQVALYAIFLFKTCGARRFGDSQALLIVYIGVPLSIIERSYYGPQ